jgi:molybdopterin converting factor small subunit
VTLFAGMAEAAGCRCVELVWDKGTVRELRSRLASACPAIEPLLARSAVAIGDRYAAESDTVPHDAEIAIIPPVSGG